MRRTFLALMVVNSPRIDVLRPTARLDGAPLTDQLPRRPAGRLCEAWNQPRHAAAALTPVRYTMSGNAVVPSERAERTPPLPSCKSVPAPLSDPCWRYRDRSTTRGCQTRLRSSLR